MKGNIDPRSRVRRLLAVDLWEISIVTFPLLAGARVRAVKQAASPSQVCRPSLSHARTRAERDWAKMIGAPPVAAVSRVRPAPRRQLRYRRLDGTVSCGSVRTWRQAL